MLYGLSNYKSIELNQNLRKLCIQREMLDPVVLLRDWELPGERDCAKTRCFCFIFTICSFWLFIISPSGKVGLGTTVQTLIFRIFLSNVKNENFPRPIATLLLGRTSKAKSLHWCEIGKIQRTSCKTKYSCECRTRYGSEWETVKRRMQCGLKG